jgi:hypothetical protein
LLEQLISVSCFLLYLYLVRDQFALNLRDSFLNTVSTKVNDSSVGISYSGQ